MGRPAPAAAPGGIHLAGSELRRRKPGGLRQADPCQAEQRFQVAASKFQYNSVVSGSRQNRDPFVALLGLALRAEMKVVLADECRNGNVPPQQKPLGVVQRAFGALRGRGRVERRQYLGAPGASAASRLVVQAGEAAEAYVGAVVGLLDALRFWFGLSAYDPRIVFESKNPNESRDDGGAVVMTVRSSPVYHWIEISVYPPAEEAWRSGDVALLMQAATHEYLHVLLEPVSRLLMQMIPVSQEQSTRDVVEQVVETLTRLVMLSLPVDELKRVLKGDRRARANGKRNRAN